MKMKVKFSVFLFLVLISLALISLTSVNAIDARDCSDEGKTVYIPARAGFWIDTGIDVNEGDNLVITSPDVAQVEAVRGLLCIPQLTPNGLNFPAPNSFRAPGLPIFSLVGKINDEKFFVGTDYEAEVEETGRLYLIMNDNFFLNNCGFFRVQIACDGNNGDDEISCYVDSDCDDEDENTEDVCHHAGTSESYCTNDDNENECIPHWRCSGWSDCEDGEQHRICTDLNECDDNHNIPDEERQCDDYGNDDNRGVSHYEGYGNSDNNIPPTPVQIKTRGTVQGNTEPIVVGGINTNYNLYYWLIGVFALLILVLAVIIIFVKS